ncbi:MAG: nuclear transport factor 2 family protein [Brevundimonas sp.]|uniref:nuclear transport factor 2 family protein n=1 Tax=Brevundimonas sp. TaxID=1871086 RepID=UPI0027323763|nr:nuclear transport factor 2 family protein [Brevundimonas sp.]MDP3655967.1 nuclear transport factor 2 family protein [Brevundimonas sp.]MDZ4114236.1 nuclear transport factor 2 family protein [Brevundimonas sp.]
MTVRTILIAALTAAGAIGVPMTASAEPARPSVSGDAASDAANQAVVESLYRAFAAGDGATINGLLAVDLVWIEAENGPYADRNPYIGPAAVFEGIFGRIGAEFEGFVVTPATYLPSGDRVAALGRYTGTNRATGEALDAQFVHVFTVRGGKVTHFQQYTDTAQWVDVVTPD